MTLSGRVARLLGRTDFSVAVVVFTVPEKRIQEMAVATGPCVPLAGRKRALTGPLSQHLGELPHHTAALYTALTGRSLEGALTVLGKSGAGSLHQCTREFVDAMADANQMLIALADEDDARGDKNLTSFVAKNAELDAAWLSACEWPRDVVSRATQLTRMGWARVARERGDPLYCWHGPAVPMYAVRTGTGPFPGRRSAQ